MNERRKIESEAETERAATEWFFQRDAGFTPQQARDFELWIDDRSHRRAFEAIEHTWARLGETRPLVAGEKSRWLVRRWLPVGIAAAAAITLAGWFGRAAWTGPAEFAEQAATEVGGLRRLDLPDGSFVTLNTNSSVDVHFTADERRVRLLRGEAHFEVAKNPARPFVVVATGVAVKAVGTAFSVRVKSSAVDVLVTEGRVRVDDATGGASLLQSVAVTVSAEPPLLVAGEKVTIATGPEAVLVPARIAVVAAGEIDQALSWQKRRLDYADAPLSEIIADFNRYNQHKLVVADPRLGERRFGGTFPAGDYASLVQLLEKTFGVVVERRERETVLRLP
jgi:transmembrane sensor